MRKKNQDKANELDKFIIDTLHSCDDLDILSFHINAEPPNE